MKRWFVGVMVVCAAMLLLAGASVAQPPVLDPGPFHILHKQGAIYNSNTGWNLSTLPYYPGSDWAVDFVYNSQGVSILHRDGAVWNSDTGWNLNTPPYFAGTAYAKALEYLRDVEGCWCLESTGWWIARDGETEEGSGVYFLVGNLFGGQYPYKFLEITNQIGTRIYGRMCTWDFDSSSWECDNMQGTVTGDNINFGGQTTDGTTWVISGIGIFFDNGQGLGTQISGVCLKTHLPYDFLTEKGSYTIFHAWRNGCVCDSESPPPPLE